MGPARFERATSCSGGKRSIQLSYGPVTRTFLDLGTRTSSEPPSSEAGILMTSRPDGSAEASVFLI
jgi:hypothetical protein